jgi:hypothetical protein
MTTILEAFDRRFRDIDRRSRALLKATEDADLFRRPRDIPQTFAMFSIGEYILRSAGTIEQTFGGITTRLWDDPFEWTLPEKLNSVGNVLEYLDEVEEIRRKGFGFFVSDVDLTKQVPAPETLRPIFEILLDAQGRAEHYQGRAFAIFQMFSDEKLPRL